jgi:hypothetical protein
MDIRTEYTTSELSLQGEAYVPDVSLVDEPTEQSTPPPPTAPVLAPSQEVPPPPPPPIAPSVSLLRRRNIPRLNLFSEHKSETILHNINRDSNIVDNVQPEWTRFRSYAEIARANTRFEDRPLDNMVFHNNVVTRGKVQESMYSILDDVDEIKSTIPEKSFLNISNNLRVVYDYISQHDIDNKYNESKSSTNNIIGLTMDGTQNFGISEFINMATDSMQDVKSDTFASSLDEVKSTQPPPEESKTAIQDTNAVRTTLSDPSDSKATLRPPPPPIQRPTADLNRSRTGLSTAERPGTPALDSYIFPNLQQGLFGNNPINLTADENPEQKTEDNRVIASITIGALFDLIVQALILRYAPSVLGFIQAITNNMERNHSDSATANVTIRRESRFQKYTKKIYEIFKWTICQAPLNKVWRVVLFLLWFNLAILIGVITSLVTTINDWCTTVLKNLLLLGIFLSEELLRHEHIANNNVFYLVLLECTRLCRIRIETM